MAERRVAVETSRGILGVNGGLELFTLRYRDRRRVYVLELGLPDSGVRAELEFDLVWAMTIVPSEAELEAELPPPRAAFDEILESSWVAKLGGKVSPEEHRHFVVQTQNEVFSIVCAGYRVA